MPCSVFTKAGTSCAALLFNCSSVVILMPVTWLRGCFGGGACCKAVAPSCVRLISIIGMMPYVRGPLLQNYCFLRRNARPAPLPWAMQAICHGGIGLQDQAFSQGK